MLQRILHRRLVAAYCPGVYERSLHALRGSCITVDPPILPIGPPSRHICAKSGSTSQALGLGGSFLSYCPEDSTGTSVAEGHLAIMQLFVRTGTVLLPTPCSISWILLGTLPTVSEYILRPSTHFPAVVQHSYVSSGSSRDAVLLV